MRNIIHNIYRFLPVQLVFIHFRKYQLLLLFWLILFATISGHFASAFGASSLFLAPEYLGKTNVFSMVLLGGTTAVFIMAWHITTFIIHSKRLPFLGATRHSFLKYCINNSIIPFCYLAAYTIIDIYYLKANERAGIGEILKLQFGFYLGGAMIAFMSFAYFFRVDRDLLKVVLAKVANPSLIKQIIPYDTLDIQYDIIKAETYVTGKFNIKKFSELEPYSPRLLDTVLRKHHRNAITATLFALVVLLTLGIFMDNPKMRIPAAAGFLLLFAVVMGAVGAMKYFLRSWEMIGWICLIFLMSVLVNLNFIHFRSIAYGIDYSTNSDNWPKYDYEHLKALFTPEKYLQDKITEEHRLDKWKAKNISPSDSTPPLIIIAVSGGGSRAAYWTFRSLQYLDSITNGELYNNTVLMTGASGGMIGAAYWRDVHKAYKDGLITKPYDQAYQYNVGKDLLNAIIFSLASVDIISPINKISIAGRSYKKNRGYAFEKEIIANCDGYLSKTLKDYAVAEANCDMPAMIFNGTIINDGKKLMMSALPISYLTQPAYALEDTANPPIDAVDFQAFFGKQHAQNLCITSALRMSATFPIILPVAKLPSTPEINVMDAGMRDNFGVEVAMRYMQVMQKWIEKNSHKVILLEIRDTREHEVFKGTEIENIGSMISEPLFSIQNKWEAFQSFNHSYMKDFAKLYYNDRLRILNMQYIPEKKEKPAAMNFHVTQYEKQDLLLSIYNPINMATADSLIKLLKTK
ncbi:MAG: patatin-like phospholipase family protein [Bacteroidetes bacterium]|nr:patatin-like phospholipase family protein [Bacteroidota bacterium]